jgi:hypothetical protein
VTRHVTVDRWVPQQYTESETYQSPKVVQLQKKIMVPQMVQTSVMVDVPVSENYEVTEQ